MFKRITWNHILATAGTTSNKYRSSPLKTLFQVFMMLSGLAVTGFGKMTFINTVCRVAGLGSPPVSGKVHTPPASGAAQQVPPMNETWEISNAE